jgi:hypothetical protein
MVYKSPVVCGLKERIITEHSLNNNNLSLLFISSMILHPIKFALAAALAFGSTSATKDIYDYVIVGSGPGGGSLA